MTCHDMHTYIHTYIHTYKYKYIYIHVYIYYYYYLFCNICFVVFFVANPAVVLKNMCSNPPTKCWIENAPSTPLVLLSQCSCPQTAQPLMLLSRRLQQKQAMTIKKRAYRICHDIERSMPCAATSEGGYNTKVSATSGAEIKAVPSWLNFADTYATLIWSTFDPTANASSTSSFGPPSSWIFSGSSSDGMVNPTTRATATGTNLLTSPRNATAPESPREKTGAACASPKSAYAQARRCSGAVSAKRPNNVTFRRP